MLLGDIIDSILAALAILHQKDLKNRLIYNQDELENSVQLSLFFHSSWCKIASTAKNSVPQEAATTFTSLLYKSFFYGYNVHSVCKLRIYYKLYSIDLFAMTSRFCIMWVKRIPTGYTIPHPITIYNELPVEWFQSCMIGFKNLLSMVMEVVIIRVGCRGGCSWW